MPTSRSCGFNVVGYGCTTCIGNSGPLPDAVVEGDRRRRTWSSSAVLSGQPQLRGPRPPARCGRTTSPRRRWSSPTPSPAAMDIDWDTEPLGTGRDGQPVFLKDIWPTHEEVAASRSSRSIKAESFERHLRDGLRGRRELEGAAACPTGDLYAWDASPPTSPTRRTSTA